MIECPRCQTPNAEGARFCNSCGSSLVTRVDVQERRVVTALFADLARSTSMGERLDPEVVRGMVGRFFELARANIEQRGGTIEKFSGDAVMAVFGLPLAHEDDPERAVRAAIAIRAGVAAIALDTQASHGIALQARIGIESGEVVMGDPFGGGTMATGDAMNVAARLEQQAEPGEIAIGPAVWEQVHDLVTADAMGEVALKGRDEKVKAWRVSAISTEVGRPRGVPGLEAPLTGRDEELNLVLDAARRARHEGKATLFTILGVPGVGKSRLVREVTAQLVKDGWSVFKGRCLPYGEGITYWPVAEMVRDMAGITADTSAEDAPAAVLAISPEPAVAEALATALGWREASDKALAATDRDVAWAFRRLIEHNAQDGPLVLIFEDIHWAEPQLLDLIEQLVTWTRDAPLLVVCPARPELLDTRPAWGAGRMESARIQLEPLSEEESRSLLSALLTVDDLPAELRQRVLDRAEGNPLFVEEVVRMLIEEGIVERRGDKWHANGRAAAVRVPDSVEAIIRARLDTLPMPERVVLQAASVVGRIFQQSAVMAIAPAAEGTPRIESHLEDAVLRDLITQERALDEPTFRFRHILIRDVAYATLPKARRAELHHAVAVWLRAWFGDRVDEFVEIEAYHLEQAVGLRRELDGNADPAHVQRAVAALIRCADKALAREDARAALGFAERGLALDPEPGEIRLELEWRRVDALRMLGKFSGLSALAHKVELDAQALGRLDIEGRALHARGVAIWLSRESADLATARGLFAEARKLIEAAGDTWFLGSLLGTSAYTLVTEGDLRRASQIWAEYVELARRNGWVSRQALGLARQARQIRELGDIATVRKLLAEAHDLAQRGPSRLVRVQVQSSLAQVVTLSESLENGEQQLLACMQAWEELGNDDGVQAALWSLGYIELWRDRPAEALAYFDRALELTQEHAGYWPELKRLAAQSLLELGSVADAAVAAEAALAGTAADDVATGASASMVLGLVREAQGQFEGAEDLLTTGVRTIETSDYNPWEPHLALAEFLLRRGRIDEGREMAAKALDGAARYGPDSPLISLVERRVAQAAPTSQGHP